MLSEEEELFKSQFSEQGATVSLGISIPFYQRNLTMNPKFLLFYHQLEGKIDLGAGLITVLILKQGGV